MEYMEFMKLRHWIGLWVMVCFIVIGICYVPNSVTFNYPQNYGIANQVEKVMPSVVHIEKEGVCQGSGCIISEDGIIFTAKHVTEGGGDFIVTLNDGRKYKTDICIEDTKYDVAFLKIKDVNNFDFSMLADLDDCRVGDGVFISGSPFGFGNFNSVSLGILSSKQRNLDTPHDYGYGWGVTFQSDATAEPGNSGGPVFNMAGDVIGVLVAGMDATVNYSVPVAVFKNNIGTIRNWFELSRFNLVENEPELIDNWDSSYSHSYSP